MSNPKLPLPRYQKVRLNLIQILGLLSPNPRKIAAQGKSIDGWAWNGSCHWSPIKQVEAWGFGKTKGEKMIAIIEYRNGAAVVGRRELPVVPEQIQILIQTGK